MKKERARDRALTKVGFLNVLKKATRPLAQVSHRKGKRKTSHERRLDDYNGTNICPDSVVDTSH